jgi:hypothetical protein
MGSWLSVVNPPTRLGPHEVAMYWEPLREMEEEDPSLSADQ